MSARGQKVLIQHLTDPDSLETIAAEGLADEIIPTEVLRPIIAWAVDYYFRSGCNAAPSVTALREFMVGNTTAGDILDDNLIDLLEEPEDTVEWAIEDLKATYVHKVVMQFNKSFATDMSAAATHERVEVLNRYASELISVSMSVESRASSIEVRQSVDEALLRYEARQDARGKQFGMHFGLPDIDAYTYFIHDGELAMLGAGPKVGKSWFLNYVAWREWCAGRRVVLFTLENSVEMTFDRIACFGANVDPTDWQRGDSRPEEIDRYLEWSEMARKADNPLWILQPDLGKRSFEHMVREAQLREAQTLIIDQLNHVELPDPNKPKTERIGDGLHRLKGMISTGHHRMPCLLAAHINRSGVRNAEKFGYHSMDDFGDSTEIERTADWAFALYRSPDDEHAYRMLFQTLASRRMPLSHWDLKWLDGPSIEVLQERELPR